MILSYLTSKKPPHLISVGGFFDVDGLCISPVKKLVHVLPTGREGKHSPHVGVAFKNAHKSVNMWITPVDKGGVIHRAADFPGLFVIGFVFLDFESAVDLF